MRVKRGKNDFVGREMTRCGSADALDETKMKGVCEGNDNLMPGGHGFVPRNVRSVE